MTVGETYPHQYARTRRFTCGEPRSLHIAGDRLFFLRSEGGDDPINRLWWVDLSKLPSLTETLLVNPAALLAAEASSADLPAAEKARRERLRETGGGITAYSTNSTGSIAAFTLAGSLFSVVVDSGEARNLPVAAGAYEARVSPDGRWVAYLAEGALRLVGPIIGDAAADSAGDVTRGADPIDRILAHDYDPDITWGSADFIASEEFSRYRGFWWSPDSSAILAERVDNTAVQQWWISDPSHPDRPPSPHRYPAAGTDNAELSLAVFDLTGVTAENTTGIREPTMIDVGLSAERPYLVHAEWTEHGIVAVTLSRSQRHQRTYLLTDDETEPRLLDTVDDPAWVELIPGTPAFVASDAWVQTQLTRASEIEPEGATGLARCSSHGTEVTSTVASPPQLQIRSVVRASQDSVLVQAVASSPIDGVDIVVGPEHQCVVALSTSGVPRVVMGRSDQPGQHTVVAINDSVVVVRSATLDRPGAIHRVLHNDLEVGQLATLAETPLVTPSVTFLRAGLRRLPVAVLLPSDPQLREPGVSLPIVMDPYGGPHAQRVVASFNAHLSSQWLADQGFAVVVVDGRGTPALGPVFERTVHGDLAGPTVADQVIGLLDAAERNPQLDLSRVGIRGWSFGGYLAALAVLRRPDVFHCAVAGAPVTDWALYDTGYSERYLGDPIEDDGPYVRTSLIESAESLTRPLMLIHGLADDNVVAAHTLQFSTALLSFGKPHEVLPLSGVTHMTPQPIVAEHLQMLQLDFLRRHLGGPRV